MTTQHKYYGWGLFLLLIGIELNMVSAFELAPQTIATMAEFSQAQNPTSLMSSFSPVRTILVPVWVAWSFLSLGVILMVSGWVADG